MNVCKQYYISGRVQGVWYRAATQQKAISLGVSGYAKNLVDGRVEVIACGAEESLEEFEQWLWIGPENAEVQEVISNEIEFREISCFQAI